MTEFRITHRITDLIERHPDADDRTIFRLTVEKLTYLQMVMAVHQMLPATIADTRASLTELRGSG